SRSTTPASTPPAPSPNEPLWVPPGATEPAVPAGKSRGPTLHWAHGARPPSGSGAEPRKGSQGQGPETSGTRPSGRRGPRPPAVGAWGGAVPHAVSGRRGGAPPGGSGVYPRNENPPLPRAGEGAGGEG